MSSHDSISMVLKCMLKGAADFLIKPVRRNELRNLWQHVWRRHSVRINISASCNPFFFFYFLVLIHIQLSETCFLSLFSFSVYQLLGGHVPQNLHDVYHKGGAISENNMASNHSSDYAASSQKNKGSEKVSDAQVSISSSLVAVVMVRGIFFCLNHCTVCAVKDKYQYLILIL